MPGAARGAEAAPESFDPATSAVIDAEMSPTRKAWDNADGTTTVEVSKAERRFLDGATWRDIDMTLERGADGALRAKAAPSSAVVGARADDGVSFDTEVGPIVLRHPDAPAVGARAEGPHATYPQALAGRDLTVALNPDGFEETVTVPSRDMAATYVDELVLPAGVSLRQAGEGVELVDRDGTVIAGFGGGLAFDSAPQPSMAPVAVRLLSEAGNEAASEGTATVPTTTPDPTTTSDPPTTTTTTVEATETAPALDTTTTVPTTIPIAAPPAPAGAAEDGRVVARVEVSAGDWASDPARVYPLRLDPLVTVYKFSNPAGGGKDTFVWSATPTTAWGTAAGLYVGTSSGTMRSLLFFNLGVTPASNIYVTSAAVVLSQQSAGTCAATPMYLNSVTGAWSDTTTWNTKPTVAADTVTAPAFNKGPAACSPPGYGTPIYLTAMVERWLSGAPATDNYGMQLSSAAETNAAYNKDFASGNTAAAPYLVFTYGHRPTIAAPTAPADGARVDTATPSLTVAAASDPDISDVVSYWFKGTSGTDAVTGHLAIESGWQTSTTYQVPAGLLVDGLTYTWNVYTWDLHGGASAVTSPDWTRSFTVDLHLGAEPAAPYDAIGPAQVNLVSANLAVAAGSPAGLSYAYNSSTPPVTGAAVGRYYNDLNNNGEIDDPLVMQRRDATIGMYWGPGGPGGGVWADNFLVSWAAEVTVPAAGSYKFFVSADDGMKVWVKKGAGPNVMVLDRWAGGAALPGLYTDPVTATAGQTLSLTVDYKEASATSYANVWIEGPYGPGGATRLAPLDPSWMAADTPPLPVGWTLSPGLGYASARVIDDHVVLTDASGAPHVYSGRAGGYVPPAEEDGVLALDANGSLSLASADGTTYGFDAGGHLVSATAATDDDNASSRALLYVADGATGSRLVRITDPVSGRWMDLHYQGFDENPDPNADPDPTSATECPVVATFGAGPPGALCRVDYWAPGGAVKTHLRYVAGQLAQIEDPGDVASPAIAATVAAPAPVMTEFSYAGGKMTAIRSPLAHDAVAATTTPDITDVTDKAKTVIAYTAGRVASVSLPVPNSGATVELARTVHRYPAATTTATTATVTVDGLAGTNRSVVSDALGRTLTDTQTTGPTTCRCTTSYVGTRTTTSVVWFTPSIHR